MMLRALLRPLASAVRGAREPWASGALAALVYAVVALFVPLTQRPGDPALAMLAVLLFALVIKR